MNQFTKFTPGHGPTLIAIIALAHFGILIAGCRPTLSFEKQYSLTPAEIITLPIDPIGVEQTIEVVATSADDARFAVHVYLAKDEEAAEREISTGAENDFSLAKSTDTNNAKLSAIIPANEEAGVRISAEGNAVTVNVAINN